jgi:predicted transcriptional regulator
MNDVDYMPHWNLISFVKASKLRSIILNEIEKESRTPSELKAFTRNPLSRISIVLKELIEMGLIRDRTPKRVRNKRYSLTKLGKTVLNESLDRLYEIENTVHINLGLTSW